MDELVLIKPTPLHAQMILDYKQEFLKHGDSMHGTAGLANAETVEDWLNALERNRREDTQQEWLVPGDTFLCVRATDGVLVGMISVRHRLNDYLLRFGGHIGYSVRFSQRRKGYAKQMLGLALSYCETLGIRDVLLTCNKENTASARTILANGGILEDEISKQEKTTQRYWIRL